MSLEAYDRDSVERTVISLSPMQPKIFCGPFATTQKIVNIPR